MRIEGYFLNMSLPISKVNLNCLNILFLRWKTSVGWLSISRGCSRNVAHTSSFGMSQFLNCLTRSVSCSLPIKNTSPRSLISLMMAYLVKTLTVFCLSTIATTDYLNLSVEQVSKNGSCTKSSRAYWSLILR